MKENSSAVVMAGLMVVKKSDMRLLMWVWWLADKSVHIKAGGRVGLLEVALVWCWAVLMDMMKAVGMAA
jgi:hypothetical protein